MSSTMKIAMMLGAFALGLPGMVPAHGDKHSDAKTKYDYSKAEEMPFEIGRAHV